MMVTCNTTHAHSNHSPDEGQFKDPTHDKLQRWQKWATPIWTGTNWPMQTIQPKRLDSEPRTRALRWGEEYWKKLITNIFHRFHLNAKDLFKMIQGTVGKGGTNLRFAACNWHQTILNRCTIWPFTSLERKRAHSLEWGFKIYQVAHAVCLN
jgi:hypothetical protein